MSVAGYCDCKFEGSLPEGEGEAVEVTTIDYIKAESEVTTIDYIKAVEGTTIELLIVN